VLTDDVIRKEIATDDTLANNADSATYVAVMGFTERAVDFKRE